MAKARKVYVCGECGHETSGWLGRCPSCDTWNSFVAVTEMPAKAPVARTGSWLPGSPEDVRTEVIDLSKIEVKETRRIPTNIPELDRVLGGGIVPGSLILLGGDPGIGKSTLALEILGHIPDEKILYVSGEESETQIRMRCERLELGDKAIPLLTTTNFSTIEKILLERQPMIAVIDSIQTVYSDDLSAAPGSVSQVREAGMGLLRIAKSFGITILMTGHVTKEGAIAGPRVLEHMVDTVLYFEGERDSSLRILRSVKNRFYATDEIGIFEMTEKGLISVDQATSLFLDGKPRSAAGSVVTAILEGSRPLLLELQALTVASNYGSPIRMAQGIDRSRLIMLMAVAEKKTNLDFSSMDAYINVTGGMRIRGTSADLAILAALLSSVRDEPLGLEVVVIGEVGLTGEVRSVSRIADYLEEAYRAGWTRFVVPASARSRLRRFEKERNVRVYYVSELNEAFDLLFSKES
ncbi:MAG TPA: DNA repair protein RadA [Clostridiaceae bacterium]|nr:DNA repair protein RadA [Clostridiaceae bacterium]